MKDKLSFSKLFFLLFVTTIIITEITLSKYTSTFASDNNASVAKWQNNIEIIEVSDIELSNKNSNAKYLHFNVLSDSDVTSSYDVFFENVHNKIGLCLENDSVSLGYMIRDNSLIISFLVNGINGEVDFLLDSSNEQIISSGDFNIKFSSVVENNFRNITIFSDFFDGSLILKMEDGSEFVDVVFDSFGVVESGSYEKEHIVTFSTDEVELPVSNEVSFYAVFEQVD